MMRSELTGGEKFAVGLEDEVAEPVPYLVSKFMNILNLTLPVLPEHR